jgi:hypothetical protein
MASQYGRQADGKWSLRGESMIHVGAHPIVNEAAGPFASIIDQRVK